MHCKKSSRNKRCNDSSGNKCRRSSIFKWLALALLPAVILASLITTSYAQNAYCDQSNPDCTGFNRGSNTVSGNGMEGTAVENSNKAANGNGMNGGGSNTGTAPRKQKSMGMGMGSASGTGSSRISNDSITK